MKRGIIQTDGKLRVVNHARNFAGAQGGRLTADWVSGDGTGDRFIKQDAKSLRERGREMERNDGYAERFFTELESNIIGEKGIQFKPMATKADLRHKGGVAGKLDALACAKVAQAWADASKRGKFDVTRQFSRPQFERLAIRSTARDGGFMVRLVDGFPNNSTRFAVQGMETDLLDLNYSDPEKRIHMSVEFDEWDAPIRYHLLKKDAKRTVSGWRYSERFPVDAADMIHLFAFKRITQTQGVSWLAPIMLRLRHLSKYEEAEVIAARTSANKIGFFETEGDAEYTGEMDSDGNIKAPTGPGEWETLPAGVKANLIDPSHPNANYPDFRKAMLRGVAAGIYVNYNTLGNDLEGVNFSSIRQGVLSERDIYRMIQAWFIDEYEIPIYERWLRMALLTGQIEGLNLTDYDRLCPAEFSGRTWPWVDPLKDIKAAGEEIALSINSRQQVARDRSKDFLKTVKENEEDVAALEDAGLPTGPSEKPVAPTAPPAPKED